MKYTMLCAVALMPLLGACGADISYKMGSGVDQLRMDKKACGGAESPSYESCMKAKGWSTIDMKEKEVSSGADAEPATETSKVAEATPAPVAVAVPATPPLTASAPTAVAPTAAVPAAAPKAKYDPRDVANMKAASRPQPSKDPNTRVTVSSWWKPGANNASEAIAACVAELGDSHKPDYAKHTASQGLVTCMKKSGWYAV